MVGFSAGGKAVLWLYLETCNAVEGCRGPRAGQASAEKVDSTLGVAGTHVADAAG